MIKINLKEADSMIKAIEGKRNTAFVSWKKQ